MRKYEEIMRGRALSQMTAKNKCFLFYLSCQLGVWAPVNHKISCHVMASYRPTAIDSSCCVAWNAKYTIKKSIAFFNVFATQRVKNV